MAIFQSNFTIFVRIGCCWLNLEFQEVGFLCEKRARLVLLLLVAVDGVILSYCLILGY